MTRAIMKHRQVSGLTQSAAICLSILIMCQAAHAQPAKLSKGEISLLPDFCQDRLNYPVYSWTNPRWAYWRSRMGDSFQHVHHYCWALVSIRRATSTSNPTQREHLYASAIRDLEYVLTNAADDFRLLPEIYVRIGEAAVRTGDFGKAYDGFATARQIKPGYAPAYIGWAEVLLKAGQKGAALEILTEGLRVAPESTEMRSFLKRLGATPPELPTDGSDANNASPPADRSRLPSPPASTPASVSIAPSSSSTASAAGN
ncbi:tetratricopeptide repeat protein [Paucibacter sp. DJ1R-11]|nr:tetratricopeptide repeat protein [Paucibacter sp. DJ1R-11]